MSKPDFEDLDVYKLAEKLANEVWFLVKEWDYFTKDTNGIISRKIQWGSKL